MRWVLEKLEIVGLFFRKFFYEKKENIRVKFGGRSEIKKGF